MLIRFLVENFLSFKTETEFVLFAGKSIAHPNHVIRGKARNDIPILKSNIIYGANSSGKSNLIKAIDFARNLIIRGYPVDTRIPLRPFKLDQDFLKSPSRFEFELFCNGKNYAYGFILNPTQIIEEWLYEINRESEKLLFERKLNAKGEYSFKFKNFNLNKENDSFLNFTAKGTPPNRLFLRETKERNLKIIPDFQNLYGWFERSLNVIYPKSKYQGLAFKIGTENEMRKAFSIFFKYFSTGVDSFKIKTVDFDKGVIGVPSNLKNDIVNSLEDKNQKAFITSDDGSYHYLIELDDQNLPRAYKLMTVHLIEGKEVLFDLAEESDGTRRLMDLVPALIELVKNQSVFIVDEIDRSLHPNLTLAFVKLFHEKSKDIRSQLVITTHESNLLDLNILRKDEITFIEKDKDSSSKIYSLAEYKPRTDKSIKKDYLLGRYGAIPFLTNPSDLNW